MGVPVDQDAASSGSVFAGQDQQRQAVGLLSPPGEAQLSGGGLQLAGQSQASFFQDGAGLTASGVLGVRVGLARTEVGEHPVQDLPSDRGAGGVIEISHDGLLSLKESGP